MRRGGSPRAALDASRPPAVTPQHYLLAIASSFALFGVLETAVDPDIAVIHMFLLAVLGFAWCKADVRARQIREPRGSALLVGAVGIIGVPMYFFRSRPARAAWFAMLCFVGFAAICVFAYIGGDYAARLMR